MIGEWLAREGWIILNWWFLVTLAGAAVFPMCTRLLKGLPDRGYTLARAAGLLIVGFTFWLLAILGFLQNTTGAMLLSWVIVFAISLFIYFKRDDDDDSRINWREWWREHRGAIIVAEVLFIVMMVVWAGYRAHQHEITSTEKPMELAFVSSIMRSDAYPPNDPWMAGYAISYYYFGYVIAASLSMLSGVSSTVGFNMLIALTFALVGLTTYGVVYNLVRSRAKKPQTEDAPKPSTRLAVVIALCGTVFVTLMGNWQVPLIEIPYQAGAPTEYLSLFNSNERQTQIAQPADGLEQWSGWWWFRSARVLNDIRFDGNRSEVIDEFPAFSYILADNHPHVLSLPFAALGLGLALNALLLGRSLSKTHIIFYGICLGGLIFFNTWDTPVYIGMVIAADGLRRFMRNGGGGVSRGDVFATLTVGASITVLGLILYFPFLFSFRSQLSGILPNIEVPTMFSQFFVMFAPFILILSFFLAVEAWRAGKRINWGMGFKIGFGFLVLLIATMLIFVVLAAISPPIQNMVIGFVESNGGAGVVVPQLLIKRLTHGITALVLTLGVVFVVARLLPRGGEINGEDGQARQLITYPHATGFALLLVGFGLALTLIPEFIYLRDQFGARMNTVFKFYYQAWLLWGVASAYAVYTLLVDAELPRPSLAVRGVFATFALVGVTGGLLFIIFAVQTRGFIETGRTSDWYEPQPLTIDGAPSFAGLIGNDDMQALACLSALEPRDDAIVAEAVGGSYNGRFGRVGILTGLPVLLNWPNHEQQWRGSTYSVIAGTRESDIQRLYGDPTWTTARSVITRYGIDYIFFGSTEISVFGGSADVKFRDNLEVVCEFGNTRVYRVDEQAIAAQGQ